METLKQVMESPGYNMLSDEKKAEAIAAVYQYADVMGKMEVSDYRPRDGKVRKLESAQMLQELSDLTDEQRGAAWEARNERTDPDQQAGVPVELVFQQGPAGAGVF